jgi:hypothetical protein
LYIRFTQDRNLCCIFSFAALSIHLSKYFIIKHRVHPISLIVVLSFLEEFDLFAQDLHVMLHQSAIPMLSILTSFSIRLLSILMLYSIMGYSIF